ncbi:MAG TPA: IS481 family transposase [Polyangiaceae bacterium]|nr:IS481 family transposase [Polyangiaceae bacterium]
MDERVGLVMAMLRGEESHAELCRRFGVSRKTAYKWLERHRQAGEPGLMDRSSRPHRFARAISPEVVRTLLAAREQRGWGPRKIKAWLEAKQPEVDWPAASTIGSLYDGYGLTRHRRPRRRTPPSAVPLRPCDEPNAVWAADFKGWVVTGDGVRVDPFTLSDGYSRYLLRCEVVDRPDGDHVWPVLQSAFREYGLPRALRSDNGPPFASTAAGGLSRLGVLLIKSGVTPERIEPGKPEQNGRHERMHLTLKQETCTPPAATLADQVERFRTFREIYNHERPHEALGQRPPIDRYKPSPRAYDGKLREPDYPREALVRRVRTNGTIKWRGELLFVSSALVGEPIALYEVDDQLHILKYADVTLGKLNGRQGFRPVGAGRSPRTNSAKNEPRKLSPRSPG